MKQRLDRLEALIGHPHEADPLVIHTGVPRAEDPSGLVTLAPKHPATPGARP